MFKKLWVLLFFIPFLMAAGCEKKRNEVRLLVFTKTAGYRHASITNGIEALKKIAAQNQVVIDTTENAAKFNEENLKRYSAVVFLSTTGDVLNHFQQADFERYIQAGGGYVGIHAAADCEYQWDWYGKMVGGYFKSHPEIQDASLQVVDKQHPATEGLPDVWKRKDEWYNYRDGSLNPQAKVLLKLDEASYKGGEMQGNHPISWYHDFDGGRAFYTGLGHTEESWTEAAFLKHLMGGIRYAIGENLELDYSKAKTQRVPEADRFSRTVLIENLNEPMQLEVLPDGDVLFVERKGAIHKYDAQTNQTAFIDSMKVYSGFEDGLLGLELDPKFSENNWLYMFYSPVGTDSVQHVSRFVFKDDKLDKSSEKVLLKIPLQRKECCHSAGSLEFDTKGNLWISLGDNTNPFFSDGFAPIDEQKGRDAFDAQRSSGNMNDLRGKILRIHPEADGTYTIPDGNLFPKDGTKGRPEIYIMGNRNPFRFAIDPKNNWVYWGEVGPDAPRDSTGRGPRGHDEVNQARGPGFFGWPYFVGNNKPYNDYDFAAKKTGASFDPAHPKNLSPNNTGLQDLPPAQPALIWYPYAPSEEFPQLAAGSRNAMAGPFYDSNKYKASSVAFPAYYDGLPLIYDWMRGWLFHLRLDDKGDLVQLEPFLQQFKFNNMIDMKYGPDGALYILEYGSGWFSRNLDARISKITFNSGNRLPEAKVTTDKTNGALPLTVKFSGAGSKDADRDSLTYAWTFEGEGVQSSTRNATYTFSKAGEYRVKLTVKDPAGASHEAFTTIIAGNAAPQVAWNLPNTSFYWEGSPVSYQVAVTDVEDGQIDPKLVAITVDPLGASLDQTLVAQGHQQQATKLTGEQILKTYNCFACHKLDSTNVGPSYKAVAEKYKGQKGVADYLMRKIRNGGTGAWGTHAMPANPQLSDADLREVVQYILALANKAKENKPLPLLGSLSLKNSGGLYLLKASYQDKGANGLAPQVGTSSVFLRPPLLQAEHFDEKTATVRPAGGGNEIYVENLMNGAFIAYNQLDLTNIKQVTLKLSGKRRDGRIEMRLGSPNGVLVGGVTLTPDAPTAVLPVTATQGRHSVYFVFKNDVFGDRDITALDWVRFDK